MGGRTRGTWTKERHGSGRKKGSKVVSRVFSRNLKRIYEEYGEKHPDELAQAIHDGIRARPPKSFPYLQLWSHYILGKPVETVKVEGQGLTPTTIVFELAQPKPAELPEPPKALPAVIVEHVERGDEP